MFERGHFKIAHDVPTAGHLGIDKYLEKIKQHLYWLSMKDLLISQKTTRISFLSSKAFPNSFVRLRSWLFAESLGMHCFLSPVNFGINSLSKKPRL